MITSTGSVLESTTDLDSLMTSTGSILESTTDLNSLMTSSESILESTTDAPNTGKAVSETKPSNNDNDLVKILVPTLIVIALLILIVVLLVVLHSYKKRKLKKEEEALGIASSDTTSSSISTLHGSGRPDGSLPPLPVDSVFGHDRITGEFSWCQHVHLMLHSNGECYHCRIINWV